MTAPQPAPPNGMPTLPQPGTINLQGMLTPPDGAGRVYIILRMSDPAMGLAAEVRFTSESARTVGPKLGEILVNLSKQADSLMRQAGLLVSPGLVLPGNPGFMPPQGG